MTAEATSILNDVEWAIGDALVAAMAVEERPGHAKREAARATRRDLPNLTWIARTCEAFPLGRRRDDLPFAHHLAVMNLDDADRDAMLDRAAASGWSARKIRREVMAARVAAGTYTPPVDDDPDDKLYRAIVQAWNRATSTARDLFLGSAGEVNLAEIVL